MIYTPLQRTVLSLQSTDLHSLPRSEAEALAREVLTVRREACRVAGVAMPATLDDAIGHRAEHVVKYGRAMTRGSLRGGPGGDAWVRGVIGATSPKVSQSPQRVAAPAFSPGAPVAVAGTPATTTKAPARASRMSMQEFRSLSPADRMQFIKSGGKLTD